MLSRNTIVICASSAAILVAAASIFLHSGEEEQAPLTEDMPPLSAESLRAEGEAGGDLTVVDGGTAAAEDAAADGEEEDPAEQQMSQEELDKLPRWDRDFLTTISPEARAQFHVSFQAARAAYARESWAECLSFINECELIFDGTPHLWNLKSCALLEMQSLADAETSIRRVLELLPNDQIALMNLASLHVARKDYRAAIPQQEKLRSILRSTNTLDQLDLITFNQLLCHLMLRQEMEARALVADVDIMRDSPLHFCSQAAFAIYKGDSDTAGNYLAKAARIYGNDPLHRLYLRKFSESGLKEKYVTQPRPNTAF